MRNINQEIKATKQKLVSRLFMFAVSVAVLVMLSLSVSAATCSQFRFTGTMYKSGSPLTTADANINITLWDAATGGTNKYASGARFQHTYVANGQYSLISGCVSGLSDNTEYYYDLMINGSDIDWYNQTAAATFERIKAIPLMDAIVNASGGATFTDTVVIPDLTLTTLTGNTVSEMFTNITNAMALYNTWNPITASELQANATNGNTAYGWGNFGSSITDMANKSATNAFTGQNSFSGNTNFTGTIDQNLVMSNQPLTSGNRIYLPITSTAAFLRMNGSINLDTSAATTDAGFIQWRGTLNAASRSWGLKPDNYDYGEFNIMSSNSNDNQLDTYVMSFGNNGNVGIGNHQPIDEKLTVTGNASISSVLRVGGLMANVGINNTAPDAALHVTGGVCIDTDAVCTEPGQGSLMVQTKVGIAGAPSANEQLYVTGNMSTTTGYGYNGAAGYTGTFEVMCTALTERNLTYGGGILTAVGSCIS